MWKRSVLASCVSPPWHRLHSSSVHHESSFNIAVVVKLHLAPRNGFFAMPHIAKAHVSFSTYSCVSVTPSASAVESSFLQMPPCACRVAEEIMKTVKTLQLYRVLPSLCLGIRHPQYGSAPLLVHWTRSNSCRIFAVLSMRFTMCMLFLV